MDRKKIILFIFSLLSIFEITGELLGNETLVFIFKPMLMLPLIIFSYYYVGKPLSSLLIVSLIFSWSGDVNLLFVYLNENFFLSGLASFLIAHILYIVIFKKEIKNSTQPSNLKLTLVASSGFLLFYILLMTYLFPNLKEFAPPVLVYGLVICAMGIFAFVRKNKVNKTSFKFVYLGALIFILSDTTIAINKFAFSEQLPFASTIIMTTYTLAQVLIVVGISKNSPRVISV